MIKNIEVTSNKSFKKYLWILIALSLILLSAVYFSNFEIFKKFGKNIIFSKEQLQKELNEKQQESNLIYQKPELEAEASVEQLVTKEPESIIENFNIQPIDVEESNNENRVEANKIKTELIENFNQKEYLAYLRNINRMIINFLLDKSYTNYLNKIKIFSDLPKTFNTLLENLEEYNDHYLINPPTYRKQVFPNNSDILQKFIRIDKNSAELDIKLEKRNKIVKKLKSWVDYCYTEDFKIKFNRKN